MRITTRSIPWLACGLLLSACATTADRLEHLDRVQHDYEKAIRWAQFDAAISFRKLEPGEPIPSTAALKNVRVTRYTVNNSSLGADKMSATQVVTINYYRTDTSRERSVVDRQQWKYFSDDKHWYLMTPLPEFP